MRKTVHYRDGCPWADGELQMADTRQTTNWKEVTCKHCLRSRTQRAADLAHDPAELFHAVLEMVNPNNPHWRKSPNR